MRCPGLSRILGGACALAVLASSPASAQVEEGRWRVIQLIGITAYDEATPFKSAAFVGSELQYQISPQLRLGVGLNVARPVVDGSYFPLALMRVHSDTTMLVEVGQQVTQINYMGVISGKRELNDRFQVYGQAGLGAYTFFLDRRVMESMERRGAPFRQSGFLLPLGVGFSIGGAGAAAIRLEARDDIIFGFDRDAFNPVEPRLRNECTPGVHTVTFCLEDANGTPPEAKSTNHNFKFILGFELVPGGR